MIVRPTDGKVNFCAGEITTLTATVGENIVSYEWYRDGVQTGNTSSTISVSQSGTYYIIARVNNCGGDPTQTSNQLTITYNPTPVAPAFSTSPDASAGNLCAGDEVTFNLRAPELSGVAYEWNFGDGSPLVRTVGDETVTRIFKSAGTGIEDFTVTVTAINQQTGCTSVATQTVSVLQTPEISFTEKSNFEVCLPDDVAPKDTSIVVELTNTTVAPYLSDIRTYYVDWGNGAGESVYPASPSPFPLKAEPYDTLGNYEIRIRAVNRNGCEVTSTQIFKYNQDPKANFGIAMKERVEETQMPPCVPVNVTLADSAKGGGLSYRWSVQPKQGWTFIEGDSTSKEPKLQFTVSGVYTIQQIVENSCGADTTSQGIVVGWPQVQVPASVTSCGPTEIDYSSSGPGGGMGGGLFVDKNLGENITVKITITGPTSATRTFTSDTFQYKYNFTTPGRYTVAVEAINECGSSNSIYQGQPAPVQEVVILQQPAAPIVQAPGVACVGDTVRLTPTGPGPIFAWFDTNVAGAAPITTGASFTTPTLSADVTYYVAAIDTANGIVCISPLTAIPIEVVPGISNNTIEVAGEQVRNLCKGDVPPVLTGSTPTGGDPSAPPRYRWEISTTGPTAGFGAAPGTNNTQNYTPSAPVSGNTWFRRLVFSGSCAESISDPVAIVAVDPVPASANTISPASQEICAGDTPAPLVGSEPTGGAGRPYTFMWEISTTGPETGFASAPGTNDDVNYTIPAGALREGEVWFRRSVTSGGCTAFSAPVKIILYPALENNTISTETPQVCTGTAPDIITGAQPTGGSGTYTYLWLSSTASATAGFNPAAGTNSGQNFVAGRLARTTWFRRVVRSAGCAADTSAALQILVTPALRNNTITATQTEVCTGQAPTNAITGSSPTDGAGGYTYLWESSTVGPDAGFVQAAGTNNGINYTPEALARDTWFRRVVFSGGCSDTSNVAAIAVLPVPAAPTLTAETRSAVTCIGGTATLAVANPDGLEYRWYTSSTGGNPVFIGAEFLIDNVMQTTTYYVEAVNASECTSTSRTPATVTAVPIVANAGEDVEIIQGRPAALQATGGATYRWEPAESLSDPNIANPVARPNETTTYTVTVTTAEGCVDTDEVTITVIPALQIPNAFTPNGDSFNEVWELGNVQEYPDMRVEVFNRWGNKVFSSKGYATPWNGTFNGKQLPVATYYYLIYLDGTSNEPLSGDVTIIR
ncbi:hypothetical protein GCM10007389_17990 [Pontibacter akesuensis]|nr:hypothetical protein GCM10007389_17990 [Pontibacter akesuensis]